MRALATVGRFVGLALSVAAILALTVLCGIALCLPELDEAAARRRWDGGM